MSTALQLPSNLTVLDSLTHRLLALIKHRIMSDQLLNLAQRSFQEFFLENGRNNLLAKGQYQSSIL